MKENNIIIFDGVCNLCNWTVGFIIKHDSKAIFKFTSIQSEFGARIMQKRGYSSENPESVLLLKDEEILSKSSAAISIAAEFNGAWKLLALFRIFPIKFRDKVYDWVAANRYHWFGKRDECMIPTEEILNRFL